MTNHYEPSTSIFDSSGALSRGYLLRRGYCCENGCRNCPYGFSGRQKALPAVNAGTAFGLTDAIPTRIVSLCPSNTEIVAALGLLDRLVGVDDWSDWPTEIEGLPRLGPDLDIRMDAVERLKPDLVIASLSVPGMARNVRRLRDRRIPHIVLDPHSIGDVWESMRFVGRVAGAQDHCEDVIAELQSRILRVRRSIDFGGRRKPRLYWEWWPKPLFAPGGRNWLTGMCDVVQCVNVSGSVDADSVKLEPAEVIALNPELILLVWTGIAKDKVRPAIVRRRPGWDAIDAVRNDRIYVLDEGLFCRPSPRLVDGLEQLAGLVSFPHFHPESTPINGMAKRPSAKRPSRTKSGVSAEGSLPDGLMSSIVASAPSEDSE